MTKEELIAFESEIKELFLQKRIHCPIHLSGGNEDALIEIFKGIKHEDWVFSNHRSHYHALLKGIPAEWLKSEILDGRSMHIMNPEYHFFCSSIVGGNLSIAVGVAMAIKMKGENRKVFVFNGDMAAESGIFHESTKYSKNFNLPITFIIEDNSYSTNTPTEKVWGIKRNKIPEGQIRVMDIWDNGKILKYCYNRIYPHVGVGQWVTF